MLKDFRILMKLKNMDDPVVAKKARMTRMRDIWLIGRGLATPEIKAGIKKVARANRKLTELLEKLRGKEMTGERGTRDQDTRIKH